MPSDRRASTSTGSRCAFGSGPGRTSRPRRLLLVPGTAATVDDWDVVAAQLSQQRTVVAVDLRGHGSSEWPGTYSMALFADDLKRVLERLGAGPVRSLSVIRLGGSGRLPRRRVPFPTWFGPSSSKTSGSSHPRPAAMPERPAGRLAVRLGDGRADPAGDRSTGRHVAERHRRDRRHRRSSSVEDPTSFVPQEHLLRTPFTDFSTPSWSPSTPATSFIRTGRTTSSASFALSSRPAKRTRQVQNAQTPQGRPSND